MRFSAVVAALLPVGAAFAQTTHTILVGNNGTLTFSPTSVMAAVGDTVAFQFMAKNHSVTQSTFANPCANLTNADGTSGIDSGFQAVAANATQFPSWSFTVNNASAPLWFYCRQTNPANHCQKGMVFALNPTATKTFDAFQQAAMAGGNATTSAGSASPSASGSTGGAAGSAGASAAATGTGASPSASASTKASGAGSLKAGGAAGVLLAGVGLVAGLVL